MQQANKVSSQARVRRFVVHLSIFTVLLFILAKFHRYYSKHGFKSFDDLDPVPPYNEYIDEKGRYLPYPGYKIIQLLHDPVSPDYSSLRSYLSEQFDLTAYFKLVPYGAHHVTLSNLKNQTSLTQNQLEILRHEQGLLDKDETSTTYLGNRLVMIDKREIRLEIESTNEQFLASYKTYKKRWDKSFGDLIIEHPTSFYITLAYQYREIPHRDLYDEVIKIIKLWETFPIEINLGPIEIISYANLISYMPVLSDPILD